MHFICFYAWSSLYVFVSRGFYVVLFDLPSVSLSGGLEGCRCLNGLMFSDGFGDYDCWICWKRENGEQKRKRKKVLFFIFTLYNFLFLRIAFERYFVLFNLIIFRNAI